MKVTSSFPRETDGAARTQADSNQRAIDANAVPISFQPRPTEMRMLSADQATMNEQNYEVGEITHQLSIIATFELIY